MPWNAVSTFVASNFMIIPCVGQYIWKMVLVNLANDAQFVKISPTITYKYSKITEDLPPDPP